jgi:hypothetical protein
MTYSPGWRATVAGAPQPTFADGLGMLVIQPGRTGPCEIHLHYDGGPEAALTRWISLLSFGGVCVWLLTAVARKK